jgi:diguanylate cyclase (GGDEF)-like protein
MYGSTLDNRIDKANLLALDEIFLTTDKALFGQILVVAFMTVILNQFIPFYIALTWFITQMINFFIRYSIITKYMKIKHRIKSYDDAKRWLKYYMMSIVVTGLLWGMTVIWFEQISKEYQYLMYAVIVGLTFASITTLGFVKEIYMAFTVPMLSILFFSFIGYSDQISQFAAMLIIVAYLYAHVAVVKFSDNFKTTMIEKERIREIQEELIQQKEIYNYQAHHDPLTGLPNRALFNDRLDQAIKKSKRNGTKVALFFLDLDRFKEINDTLGHNIGDEILINVANRLKAVMREGDTIARLGGDEFTVIMQDLKHEKDAAFLAEKIVETFKRAIIVESNALSITTSIGISLFPKNATEIQSLVRLADIAMYEAKESGRNNFKFYS